MMVNWYTDDKVVLALQQDHCRLAGYLVAHWGNSSFDRPEPNLSVIRAVQEHDSGWWEWELAPTLGDDGFPHDYIGSVASLGTGVWVRFMENGINRLCEQDPYAGLLSQMHSEGLLTQGGGSLPYMPDFSSLDGVAEFLANGRAKREELIRKLGMTAEFAAHVTPEALRNNFKYMEVFDQFGQFICNRYPLNSTARKNGPSATLSDVPVPTKSGEPDTRLTIEIVSEDLAYVDPYPFDISPLKLSFPARIVPRGPYNSRVEFLDSFVRGERISVSYSLAALPS